MNCRNNTEQTRIIMKKVKRMLANTAASILVIFALHNFNIEPANARDKCNKQDGINCTLVCFAGSGTCMMIACEGTDGKTGQTCEGVPKHYM